MDDGTVGEGASAETGTNLTGDTFNYKEHLSPEFATHPGLENIKDLNGLAKSYISGQEMVGRQRLPLPAVDADSETMGKFYDSIGRPSGTDDNGYGYDFSKSGDLPEGLVKNEKMENFFRKAMHENGLTQKQAEGMYQAQVDYSGQAITQGQTTQAETEKGWDTQLRQEFGLAHAEQMDAAKQAIEKFGTDDLRTYFNDSRLGNHPEMIKFAAKVGASMVESGNMGAAGRSGGNQMTPDQAKTEIANLQRNPGFMKNYNEQGSGHNEAVGTMQRLHDAAYPEMAE